MARGASRAAATEVEAAAATLLKAACSFSPDTLVLLKNGKTKPISEVKPGDEVAAADPGTGKRKDGKPVTDRFAHQDDDLVDVTVRSADGRTSVLRTTADHPFWNDTLQTWTTAVELRPGDRLNTATDTHARVVGVTDRAGSAAMYNLTVDELHTYYVLAGSTPVLVHNGSGNASIDDFRGGSYFHTVLNTAHGNIDVGAFVEIDGNKLVLDNVAIYGADGDLPRGSVGASDFLALKRKVIDAAAAQGL